MNTMKRKTDCLKRNFKFFSLIALFLSLCGGCGNTPVISREDFPDILSRLCRNKYQARVTCRPVNDTVWIYLPYTSGRSGIAASEERENDLYLEYSISSFNPYRALDPPELKFLVQKIILETRNLLLKSRNPYHFFVLVAANIENPMVSEEQWYIGYIDDIRNYSVGEDFSGEGYSRLVWHVEKLKAIEDANGNKSSPVYLDTDGKHVNYHDMTLKEFIDKQIVWRIYKRFTIEYSKTPFDLTAQEKLDEVLNIVKTVFLAYNYSGFENIYLKDSSFLNDQKYYEGHSQKDVKEYKAAGIARKPAF